MIRPRKGETMEREIDELQEWRKDNESEAWRDMDEAPFEPEADDESPRAEFYRRAAAEDAIVRVAEHSDGSRTFQLREGGFLVREFPNAVELLRFLVKRKEIEKAAKVARRPRPAHDAEKWNA